MRYLMLVVLCLSLAGCKHFDTNAFCDGVAGYPSNRGMSYYERQSLEYQRRQTWAAERANRQRMVVGNNNQGLLY